MSDIASAIAAFVGLLLVLFVIAMVVLGLFLVILPFAALVMAVIAGVSKNSQESS